MAGYLRMSRHALLLSHRARLPASGGASPFRASHVHRPLLPALLALCLTSCALNTSPMAARPLRVMVYNIHAGKDAGGVDNLQRVAALVAESDADVVLLQEVDR